MTAFSRVGVRQSAKREKLLVYLLVYKNFCQDVIVLKQVLMR
jgi:hypothetical protein